MTRASEVALERSFTAFLMTFDLLSLNCFHVVNSSTAYAPRFKATDEQEYMDIWCKERVEIRIKLKEANIRLRLLKQRLRYLQSLR